MVKLAFVAIDLSVYKYHGFIIKPDAYVYMFRQLLASRKTRKEIVVGLMCIFIRLGRLFCQALG